MEVICLATIWPQNPHGRSEVFVLGELLREYRSQSRDWALRVVVASLHKEALDVACRTISRFPEIRADFWLMEARHSGTSLEEISFCKEKLRLRLAAETDWDWLFYYDPHVWTRIGQVPEWMGIIGMQHDSCVVEIEHWHREKQKCPSHALGAYFHHRALLARLENRRVAFPGPPEGRHQQVPDRLLHDSLECGGCRKVVPDSLATLSFSDEYNANIFTGGKCRDARDVRNASGAWTNGGPPALSPGWLSLDVPRVTVTNRSSTEETAEGRVLPNFVHVVPYSLEGNIADAYNEAIAAVNEAIEWVLITDADVMVITPRYGHLIAQVIKKNPGAGLITCVTNRIGAVCQRAEEVPSRTADLLQLRSAAVLRWEKYSDAVTEVSPPCSGFFMLFRRTVWAAVGGFKGHGLLGVDWRFSRDIASAGLPILRMDGLLAIHFYRLDGGNKPSSAALPKVANVRAPAPRTRVLNTLVRTRAFRTYLEIGIGNPADNFQRIRCVEKTGVDPAPRAVAPGIVKKRSEDFFRGNRRSFDLIFIDGDHRAEAVACDIRHGLAALSPGGVLVMHDALPPAETFTREEDRKANNGAWTGGAWEAVLRCFSGADHHCCIVDADWGVAVVDTGKQRDHAPLPPLPEGPLDYSVHFPLLAPFRVSLEDWLKTQESEGSRID